MEFLKELFGTEALTYDQLAARVSEKKLKLADLSGGAYVGKEKFETLMTEKNGLKEMLETANQKLAGYDPDWKQKAEQAKREAEEKVLALQRGQAVREQSAGLRFSSESAKRAFLSDVEAKGLPLQDGKLLGFDDFVKAYRDSDPAAFAPEEKPPAVTASATGIPAAGTERFSGKLLSFLGRFDTIKGRKGERKRG